MHTLFGDIIPANLDAQDGNSFPGVTLGTAWYSDQDGIAHAARFYLGNRGFDTSTITGGLYDYHTGELLASGSLTITAAMPLGYTSIPFTVPRRIHRNKWYIAAIYYPCADAPDGQSHYVSTVGLFEYAGIDNGPLHALKNDTILDRRNGLYKYGSGISFPNSFFGAPSYFSDIEFEYAAFMPVYDASTEKYISHPVKHKVNGSWQF